MIAPDTDDETRWQAVETRDRSADGQFYYGVKTSGIFCKPSCPSRPKRINVRFYATREEAQTAGFRACKRCKP